MRDSLKFFAVTSVLSLVADLGTKFWVEASVAPYTTVKVIDGFFHLTNVRNPGAAFGMFGSGGFGRIAFFVVMTLAALAFITWNVWKLPHEKRLEPLAFGLIFGGAAGNLVDRVRYGEVVDFLDFFIGSYHWHTFNVADATIVVGIAVILAMEFAPKEKAQG